MKTIKTTMRVVDLLGEILVGRNGFRVMVIVHPFCIYANSENYKMVLVHVRDSNFPHPGQFYGGARIWSVADLIAGGFEIVEGE